MKVENFEFSLIFWKAGMAIAASKPMITTTIIISIKVNPKGFCYETILEIQPTENEEP